MSKFISLLILTMGTIQCLVHLSRLGYHDSILFYYSFILFTSKLIRLSGKGTI